MAKTRTVRVSCDDETQPVTIGLTEQLMQSIGPTMALAAAMGAFDAHA